MYWLSADQKKVGLVPSVLASGSAAGASRGRTQICCLESELATNANLRPSGESWNCPVSVAPSGMKTSKRTLRAVGTAAGKNTNLRTKLTLTSRDTKANPAQTNSRRGEDRDAAGWTAAGSAPAS